jgi:hypothetical protein
MGNLKIHLSGLQKEIFIQQSPSINCTKWRKDELHNRKEPFRTLSVCWSSEQNVCHQTPGFQNVLITWQSLLVFAVQSQLTDKHVSAFRFVSEFFSVFFVSFAFVSFLNFFPFFSFRFV